jgi:tetratricopeptide (TPR) repeat protein
MDSEFGIDQGFDSYNDRFEQERKTVGDISERIGAEASRFALDWLDQHKNEKFFLFLHYFDPHGDYVPPEPFASEFADNLYAGEIAYTDHCIGLVLSKLKELGLYDSTLIIITADHGEMLGEHGELSHLYFIYQSAIKVPLIFRLPGQRQQKRIDELVGLIDIVPTVCSLLGIDVPQHVQGQDLSLCLLGMYSPNRDRHVYCESLFATRYNGNSLLGIVNNQFKYIQTTRPELYDLVQDPYETRNMIKELPRQAQLLQGRLKQILEQSIRQGEFETKLELDEQSRKRLESLGYAGGGIVEDFDFDQTKDDPKDLIDFHNLNMRVMALVSQQAYDEAKVSAEELVHKRPDCLVGYRHLAEIARMKKDYTGAAVYLKKAIELDPNYANAHNNLGMALALQGKLNEAISYFTRAIQLDPDSASSHYNLGNAFNQQDKVDEAITHYTEAVQIKPDYSEAHNNLGLALVSQGKLDEATTHFREVVQLSPDSANAHYILARSLKDAGKAKEAIVEFKETLRLKPDGVRAMNSLAWLLATHKENKFRNPQEAIRLAERACELTNYKDTGIVDTLAAAYASAGRFSDAAATAEKALKLIESTGDTERAQNIQKRLQLYKRGQGYTESAHSKESTIIKK